MYLGCMEAFSLLPAISFIWYYLSSYQPLTQKVSISWFCNNVGVIQSLTTLQHDTILKLNDTTNDDHDIYLAIRAAVDQQAHPLLLSPH